MIGFKTIDDFTFDECLSFLEKHPRTDEEYADVQKRHAALLRELQDRDDQAFHACKRGKDYEKYISTFSDLKGATRYTAKHIEEAAAFVMHPSDIAARATGFKKYLLFAEAYRRNWFTNVLLYLLAFLSLLFVIVCAIPIFIEFIDRVVYGDESFWSGYPGSLCIWLLSLALFVGVSKLLRWQRSGITFLILSSFIICIPLVRKAYDAFFIFSLSCILVTFILWLCLCIKKKGYSTWELCLHEKIIFRILRNATLLVWLMIVVFCIW